ncbi:hypothetical protein GV832_15080 [Rhodobacteraceae bacterium CYK-10]|jgi:hypothetical protein|uniref:SMODS-associating 2TM beta-strand rich effector domain-containing protein n=2 Tax=Stagnihabitans tardus TaxID=2699202 RepID=A0AAE4YFF0_9RHOB|nr:hypothetical protein [Stagnihabitans tardus]
MAKYVSLSFWITLAVYAAQAFPGLSAWLQAWAQGKPQWIAVTVGWVTSNAGSSLPVIVWGAVAAVVVLPGWRLVWKLPLLGSWLSHRVFPDLNGEWTVSIQSNWPIIERLKSAAASKDATFDPLKDALPSLLEANFEVRIRQTWFRTDVEFLPNDKTPLLKSHTVSVEFLKSENGSRSLAWVYEQSNKQGNELPLAVTDRDRFFGAAMLTVSDDASKLSGQYWQNRSWNQGLNAAGTIALKRNRT